MDYPNFEIVILDNGSSDGSVEFLGKEFPHVHLIDNKENLGYAAGNNVGIQYALQQGADYVFLLNNDTIVDKHLLAELVEAGEINEAVGVLAPKIYFYKQENVIASAGSRKRYFPPGGIKIIGLGKQDEDVYNRQREIDYAIGCGLLVKRGVFEKIGMLDPAYFLYREDYDFSLRVRRGGYKILYVPAAKMWHKVSVSTQGDSWTKWYHLGKGAAYFYRKNIRLGYVALPIYVSWVVAREIVLGNRKAIRPYLVGIWDGLSKPS
jgi:GT2 family glycosyltransferase